MTRFRIALPDELRPSARSEPVSNDGDAARPLGSGTEGVDDRSEQVLRWLACWARSDG